MSLFTTDDLAPDPEPKPTKQPPAKSRSRPPKPRVLLGKSYQTVREVIGQIHHGDCIHYASMGLWSTHDLIHHILDQTGPAALTLATWSLSEDGARVLVDNLKAGRLTRIDSLFDWRCRVRRPAPLAFLSKNSASVKIANCHAKCYVLLSDTWQIAIVGSANLTNNPRIEAGVIHADSQIAEFHHHWIQKEIENAHPFEAEKP